MRKTVAVPVILTACGALAACLLWASPAAAQQKLTYVDLVKRLTNLERLSTLPDVGEKAQQWSSYDRASKYDEKTGKYVNWAANGDGDGIIRKEGELSVFAEMEGPGVIWRTWSANAGKGHVKIYLDGAEAPAVDLPFDAYFNGKNGDQEVKCFTFKGLCYTAANGRDCFVPIPFQKSCKIVAEKGWGQYYHFGYTTYPKGTEVPTFKLPMSEEDLAALAKADEFFRTKLGTDPAGAREGEKTESREVTVEPGKSAVAFELTGPRAVTALKCETKFDDREDEMVGLRSLALRIAWDGEESPSVWSPLGDFFGTAPGVNAYKSFPLGLTAEGGYCFWYMPFAKSAKAEIVNDGAKPRTVKVQVTHAGLTKPIEQLARFHAKWHRDAFLPEEPERKAIDWTMLKTEGRGRFVGVMLHVWNPKGGWWGEGDEKFFVDGEKFPSTIGTGSEDYFGYAWSAATIFHQAYHDETIASGNRGHVSVNRWHIVDNVPFQTAFEADIEKYYANARPTLYAAIAYWYQAPGGKDLYAPVPVADRWGYAVQGEPSGVKGALEGEKLKVLQSTGQVGGQEMAYPDGKWSDDEQLWWTKGKVGDKLVLALPVKEDGKYEVQAVLTKARDYGIVQLYLDDKKLGEPIDLYNPEVVPTKPLSFGTQELTKGEHKLTVEIVGANEKAVKAYMFGLDYVLLKKAE